MRRPRLLVALALCLGLASTGTPAFGDSASASARPSASDVRAPVSSALPHLTARAGASALHGQGTTPPNPAFTSPNWSGYGVLGAAGQFTSVSTGWTQPRIDYSVPGAVSMWAGLDEATLSSGGWRFPSPWPGRSGGPWPRHATPAPHGVC